jgi:hypothetical protein
MFLKNLKKPAVFMGDFIEGIRKQGPVELLRVSGVFGLSRCRSIEPATQQFDSALLSLGKKLILE